MQVGFLTQWLKSEGDPVEKDELLHEVATEKMVSVV